MRLDYIKSICKFSITYGRGSLGVRDVRDDGARWTCHRDPERDGRRAPQWAAVLGGALGKPAQGQGSGRCGPGDGSRRRCGVGERIGAGL